MESTVMERRREKKYPKKKRQPIKVGIVGLGYWGPNLARNFSSNGIAKLTALCDLDEKRLSKIGQHYPSSKQFSNYSDFLKEIDAVAIATPVDTHYKLAKIALGSGKHCLIEKPMTATVAEAEELLYIAKKNSLVLAVDHTFLFTGAVQKIKEIINSGDLGEIWYYDSVRINLGLFQRDINVVWDLAPHDLSIMDYLLGKEACTLVCLGTSHVPSGLADVAYLNLEFGNGFVANFHVNWLSPVKIRSIIIGGSKKMLVYDDMEPSEKIRIYNKGIDLEHITKEKEYEALVHYRTGDMYAPAISPKEALNQEAENFVSAINGDGTLVADGEAGLRVVKLLAASDRSLLRFGARVRV
ncbi:MAG: Gfo/Idh/MocA family protein [bacterium]